MILYHGSDTVIKAPDLLHSRKNVDFGIGFYTTPLREQAVKWCGRFTKRGREGVLSKYQLCFRSQEVMDRFLRFEGSECV